MARRKQREGETSDSAKITAPLDTNNVVVTSAETSTFDSDDVTEIIADCFEARRAKALTSWPAFREYCVSVREQVDGFDDFSLMFPPALFPFDKADDPIADLRGWIRELWELARQRGGPRNPPPSWREINSKDDAHSAVDSMLRWINEAEAEGDTSETKSAHQSGQSGNILQLTGAVWHVRYENEVGDFPDRSDRVIRHLARLLTEPNRRFGALEFYPAPPGKEPPPSFSRDESSDNRAMKEYEEELTRLAQEIKDASEANDAGRADSLRTEFNRLAEIVQSQKAIRHKKRCGAPSPKEKADQALRVGLKGLKKNFRAKGLPKLADHLDKYLDNASGEWWYAPPPDAPAWHVTHPVQILNKDKS